MENELELNDDEKLFILYEQPYRAIHDYSRRTGASLKLSMRMVIKYIKQEGIQPTKDIARHM